MAETNRPLDGQSDTGGREGENEFCLLTKCWVYREGAVPLRCWEQGSGGESMRGGRRRRRAERWGSGAEG